MNGNQEPPLDVSEFKCMTASRRGVVVVFEQTNRRYSFAWQGNELALAAPEIQGACGPHPAEVVDCLARAVAYSASRSVMRTLRAPSVRPAGLLSSHLRGLLARG